MVFPHDLQSFLNDFWFLYLVLLQKFSLLISISTHFTISCSFNIFRFLLVLKVFRFVNGFFLNGLSEICIKFCNVFLLNIWLGLICCHWSLCRCMLRKFLLVLFFPHDLQSPFPQSLQILIAIQIPLLFQCWLTRCLFRYFFSICSFYMFHNLLNVSQICFASSMVSCLMFP